jgi:hypothetical protein
MFSGTRWPEPTNGRIIRRTYSSGVQSVIIKGGKTTVRPNTGAVVGKKIILGKLYNYMKRDTSVL